LGKEVLAGDGDAHEIEKQLLSAWIGVHLRRYVLGVFCRSILWAADKR